MKRVALHILFWVVILYWRANGDYLTKADFEKFIWWNLIRFPPIILSTYALIYVFLPQFVFKRQQYLLFIILSSLTFWLATSLDVLLIQATIDYNWLNLTTPKEFKVFYQFHPYRNSFNLLSIMGLAAMIRFFKLYIAEERRRHELQEEHLATTLAFLQAQVNPHFLFNALNNIYSMAVQNKQTDIALGLENLSGIMHYLTYESNATWVLLEKEITLLKNYIDIQHLRIADTDDTTISFQVEGKVTNKMIAPVILLPLLENAFKHGIKPDENSIVSIKLTVIHDTLIFKTKNTFFEKSDRTIQEKGIGLENVRKRLELLYPEQHELETQQTASYFEAALTLTIQ